MREMTSLEVKVSGAAIRTIERKLNVCEDDFEVGWHL